MEYTVSALARLSGVSPRTLRYYDQIALLSPARVSASGYRIYGREQIDRLQQILLYKELGMELESIREILDNPSFDARAAMEDHLRALLLQRDRLELVIRSVEQSLENQKGGRTMMDKEKFEGFKKRLVDENEAKYGEEIREKYGEEQVNASNEKILGATSEEMRRVEELAAAVIEQLQEAFATGDPASEEARRAVATHKEWLCFYWKEYSPEAHRNLAQMYVDDPRFTAYYDAHGEGLAAFLRDAVAKHVQTLE